MNSHSSEVKTRDLHFDLVLTKNLIESEREVMYALMQACYIGMTIESFVSDLAWKDLVILLRDKNNDIYGFSTVAYNPKGCGTKEYNVVFSGDTIIDPAYWGSLALTQGFRQVLGGLKGSCMDKPLYWFLISKGYRTYLYLPLYFRKFYPTVDKEREEDLSRVVDSCARILFPEAWKSQKGLVQFSEPKDRLKSDLGDPRQGKIDNPHIRFFLEKNSGYLRGDELVCMARVETENWLRPDPRFFEPSQAQPSSLLKDIVTQHNALVL